VLAEEKLDKIGAMLEHTPQKSLRCLTQKTGIIELSTALAKKLLKRQPYKVKAVHSLQPCNPASKTNFSAKGFCSQFIMVNLII
jgi:hypothetical protein